MAASRRQILQDLQAVADAGQENNLAEDIRVLFDSAVSEGLIEPRKDRESLGLLKKRSLLDFKKISLKSSRL